MISVLSIGTEGILNSWCRNERCACLECGRFLIFLTLKFRIRPILVVWSQDTAIRYLHKVTIDRYKNVKYEVAPDARFVYKILISDARINLS